MTSSGLGGVELFGDAHVGVDLKESWNVLREREREERGGERGRRREGREGREGEKVEPVCLSNLKL